MKTLETGAHPDVMAFGSTKFHIFHDFYRVDRLLLIRSYKWFLHVST